MFVLVLLMQFYRGGVALEQIDTDYPTMDTCEKAGRIVTMQNKDVEFVCVPTATGL